MQRNQSGFFGTNRRRSDQGLNIWALSINLLLLAMLLVMAQRIMLSYAEHRTVRDLITRVAAKHDPQSESVTDLKIRIDELLDTNQIHDTGISDIDIYPVRGATVIDANYE